MKKTIFEQRTDHVFQAFFDEDCENFNEKSLTYAHDPALTAQKSSGQFNEKGDRLVKILKHVFLFLPGVFYLFFGTLMAFEFEFFRANPFALLMAFAIGSFMTIFGIGSLKNPKHLVIPISIVIIGAATFYFFSMLGGPKYVFQYGIYFFPLALIAPFLLKSLFDDKK